MPPIHADLSLVRRACVGLIEARHALNESTGSHEHYVKATENFMQVVDPSRLLRLVDCLREISEIPELTCNIHARLVQVDLAALRLACATVLERHPGRDGAPAWMSRYKTLTDPYATVAADPLAVLAIVTRLEEMLP